MFLQSNLSIFKILIDAPFMACTGIVQYISNIKFPVTVVVRTVRFIKSSNSMLISLKKLSCVVILFTFILLKSLTHFLPHFYHISFLLLVRLEIYVRNLNNSHLMFLSRLNSLKERCNASACV